MSEKVVKYCGAKTKRGTPCRNVQGFKTSHPGSGKCFVHGGSSLNGTKAAAKESVMAMATEAESDPLEVLLKTIRLSWGSVLYLHQKIQDDYGDPNVLEESTRVVKGEEQTYLKKAEYTVWIALLGDWTDRAAKYSKMALDAGVAERVVKVQEQQAALVAGVIRVILQGLELTPDQQSRAPQLVRSALLELNA